VINEKKDPGRATPKEIAGWLESLAYFLEAEYDRSLALIALGIPTGLTAAASRDLEHEIKAVREEATAIWEEH
jgi:hypothetical protein